MAAPVSRDNPPIAATEPPPRASFRFDATKALAIACIILIILIPLGATLVAAMPQKSYSPTAPRIANGTCRQLSISPGDLRNYLEKGSLPSQSYRGDDEDPIVRALSARRAQSAIESTGKNWRTRYTLWREQINEAEAAVDAAELAESPFEQLTWLQKGIKLIYEGGILDKAPRESSPEAFKKLTQRGNAVASSLLQSAATAFLKLSPGKHRFKGLTPRDYIHAPFTENLFTSANCLRAAALHEHILGNDHEACELSEEALSTMQLIDPSQYAFPLQLDLQMEMTRQASFGLQFATLSPTERHRHVERLSYEIKKTEIAYEACMIASLGRTEEELCHERFVQFKREMIFLRKTIPEPQQS